MYVYVYIYIHMYIYIHIKSPYLTLSLVPRCNNVASATMPSFQILTPHVGTCRRKHIDAFKCVSSFHRNTFCVQRPLDVVLYGVATISRLLKMIDLFCRILSLL